jgi:hypothetical protein
MFRIKPWLMTNNLEKEKIAAGSIVLLVFVFLTIGAASLIQEAYAEGCSSCSAKVPDWTETATDFLNGKVADSASKLSGPKASRMNNEKFNSEFNSDSSSSSNSDASNDLDQSNSVNSGLLDNPAINIDLQNTDANPNPVVAKSAVKISATFGPRDNETLPGRTYGRNLSDDSSLSDENETEMAAFAFIKNMAGAVVDKLALEPVSKNEYSGIWKANVVTGTYSADVVVTGKDGSRSFNNSIQIVVI